MNFLGFFLLLCALVAGLVIGYQDVGGVSGVSCKDHDKIFGVNESINNTKIEYVDRIIEHNNTKIEYRWQTLNVTTCDSISVVKVCDDKPKYVERQRADWFRVCLNSTMLVGKSNFTIIGANKDMQEIHVYADNGMYRMRSNTSIKVSGQRVALRDTMISDIPKQVCGWFEVIK